MLNISVYEWLDKDTGEAVLLVSDNDINFLVFCPCYIEKDRKKISLDSLFSEDIILEDDIPKIEKDETGGFFAYTVVAKVISTKPSFVELTDSINIDLDGAFPGDIEKGQMVRFRTRRLSLEDWL